VEGTHLLVTTLNGTVSLEQVDTVVVAISQKLDLDMSRVVKESCTGRFSISPLNIKRPHDLDILTFDEDSSITESGLGFTDSSLKVLLEARLVPYDSHSSSTSTHGGLDDDREPVLLDEVLGQVV